MAMQPPVAAVFEAYPDALRGQLLALRGTILAVAAETKGVGPLQETLKWGQVSYLPERSGTTIRIDRDKKTGQAALYVSCNTNLLERYRTLYPDTFAYDGKRGVILGESFDEAALRHIIAMALTYHQDKKRRGRYRAFSIDRDP